MKEKEFKEMLNDKIIFGDYDYDIDSVVVDFKKNMIKNYKLYRGKNPNLKTAHDITTANVQDIIHIDEGQTKTEVRIDQYENKYIGNGAKYNASIEYKCITKVISIDLHIVFYKNGIKYDYSIYNEVHDFDIHDTVLLIICSKSYMPPIVKIFNADQSFNIEKEMRNIDGGKSFYNSRNDKITERKIVKKLFNQQKITDKFNLLYPNYHINEDIKYDSKTGFVSSYINNVTGAKYDINEKYDGFNIFQLAESIIKNKEVPEDIINKTEININYKKREDYIEAIDLSYSDESGIKYSESCAKIYDNAVGFNYTSLEFTVDGEIIFDNGKISLNIINASSEVYPLNKIYLRDIKGVPFLFSAIV